MTEQHTGAADLMLLTLHRVCLNALVVTGDTSRLPCCCMPAKYADQCIWRLNGASDRQAMRGLDSNRPYLLSAMFFCLDQVKAFALHEPEHVEKAIVARWCEALLQAQPVNEVWRNGNNVRRSAAAQALHKQCS